MSEQLKESMSAVMDSEADAFEMRRVIDEAAVDDEFRAQWHRYHLVRDVLRGGAADVRPELRSNMWRALNTESTDEPESAEVEILPQRPRPGLRRAWVGRAAGVLVATVVALLVAYNGGVFDQNVAPEEQLIAATSSIETADAMDRLYTAPTQVDERRTSGLVLRHVQAQGVNAPSIMRFMKLMTYPEPQRNMPMPQAPGGEQTSGNPESQ